MSTLVIVPCGRHKAWDKHPDLLSVVAKDAYISPTFRLNRAYAETFGDAWMVLSAKYGFIPPDFVIPGPYNVTFKDRSTGPIEIAVLHDQIRSQRINRVDAVIALGGKDYRSIVESAFLPSGTTVVAPFVGLSIGKYLQAVKRSLADHDPHLDR
ncbi:MAG TPA: hypothetical protein VFB58_19230 [Chloroflexota bacterium]|nr:hypothetical protein [Chloroflexota bacterium]